MIWSLSHCVDAEDVAELFGYTYSDLAEIIYPDIEKRYHGFEIPKKNGNIRTIHAPDDTLKSIQKVLAQHLNNYYVPKSCTHGFVKGRSIVSNAFPHTKKRYVFNIDLSNFFTTIHFGRVRNLLRKKPFELNSRVSTILAHICCYKGHLPQGAPTSPIISNMICRKLDAQLQGLAQKHNCHITRYADDITFSFSCTKPKLPTAIVWLNDDGEPEIGKELLDVIDTNGFKINKTKTRLKSIHERQRVTGLVVNNKINVDRNFIRRTGSMIHAWETHGLHNAAITHFKSYNNKGLYKSDYILKSGIAYKIFSKIVKGRVAFISMVRGKNDIIFRKLFFRLLRACNQDRPHLIQTPEQRCIDSIFIVDNDHDITQGTGFLIRNAALITNFHVVENITVENSDLVKFYKPADQKLRFTQLIKSNRIRDVASFEINADFSDIYGLKVNFDHTIKIGDEVTIIGFPEYAPGHLAEIIKTTITGSYTLFDCPCFQVKATLIHGVSGAPVFNKEWEVIGIATFGVDPVDPRTNNNGFMPISILKHIQITPPQEPSKRSKRLTAIQANSPKLPTFPLGDLPSPVQEL